MAVAEDSLEILRGFARSFFAVKSGDYFLRELHLSVHGMQPAAGDFLFYCGDFLWRAVGQEFVVGLHQFVGNGHHFAEHFLRGFGDAHVVVEALGHFALAV